MFEILVIESTEHNRGMSVIPVSTFELAIQYCKQFHEDYAEIADGLQVYTIYVYENENADPVHYSPPPSLFELRR